jgi:retron-type reverse transcriptase
MVRRTSSLREKPRTDRPRRLLHWINIGQERKVHSLVDKVYSRKNLAMAWDAVRRNGGAGGVDGQSLSDFEANLEEKLEQLHEELRSDEYRAQALRRVYIPKAGKKGQKRPLGIPTVRDRVCQQALTQRRIRSSKRSLMRAASGIARGGLRMTQCARSGGNSRPGACGW